LLRRGGRLYESRFYQRCMVAMGPAGFITLLAGWITTEAGRQPWVVYGVLRTAQAVSPLTQQDVGVSLMLFVIVYFLVFCTGIYYILKLLRIGPAFDDAATQTPPSSNVNSSGRRPLAAVE
jgi:cytochrome bd ubiquinol oxidase subunit I